MSWIYLFLAGISEITWAVALKYSDGFTKVVPGAVTVAGYIASLILLSLATKKLPLSTSYAVWTGIGVVGTALFGNFLFDEKLTVMQAACVAMIVLGIVGLRLMSR